MYFILSIIRDVYYFELPKKLLNIVAVAKRKLKMVMKKLY